MTSEHPASGARWEPPGAGMRLDLAQQVVAALFPGAIPLGDAPEVFVLPRAGGVKEPFLALQRRLAPLGLLPLLREQEGRPVLRLVPRPAPGQWKWQVNAALLVATIGTTFLSGYLLARGLVDLGYLENAVVTGIWYSASVLLILGAHEMGHKVVAVRRRIDASLPYFLPMVPLPPLPGTLGAVIVTRTPAPNRDSLMDLGASGPIAGFIAAIPVLWYGVANSFVVDAAYLARPGLVSLPDPLLVRWMIALLLDPPPGAVVLGHPLLWAGWIGLLVTAINLLPAGMLDGGHAVRAAFGDRAHQVLSFVGLGLAIVMGYYPMAIIIALLMRRGHVGPLDDLSPMSPSRRLIGATLVLIFILSAVVFNPLAGL